ncbi:MAG: PQQ-dependent sugar dehydrogenase [Solirubrobacterales bacterium]
MRLEKVGRFNEPVHLAQPPGTDSPLFVVERRGRVRVLVNGVIQGAPFLDLRREVKHSGKGGEQGLLSIAFPPDYAADGYLYVAYTDHRDALRVVEFRRSPANELRARRKSARRILRIPQPTTKHHGGLLAFGPDKHLYIGVGDGGPSGDPRNVAQRKRVLLGKLLRIDPRPSPPRPRKRGRPRRLPYTIPADNPLVGRPGRDEVFAYGLRNPWRFSFDRSPTGDLLTLADVGNERFEEINILPLSKARGANFGWSHFEGWARFKRGLKRRRTVVPLYRYPTTRRRCSVVGGYVVRDPRLSRIKGREILGRYLFGDFCSKRLFAFRPRPRRAGQVRSFRFEIPGVTSFAQDRSGRIYVLTYNGPVYRIDPARKGVEP